MYEEWFASMANDPDMPTQEEGDAIKDFIDGTTSADLAARRCTSRINKEKDPDPQLLWSLLESMTVELSETQDKVVELLGAIKRLSKPVRDGKELAISSEKVSSELGYFEIDFADCFRGILLTYRLLQILIFPAGLGETGCSIDSAKRTLQ